MNEIVTLYNKGVGTSELAALTGLHRTTIQRQLLKAGVKLRQTSPRHHYDVSFFSKFTPQSCYWAGFILADGCVRSDRATVSIHLQRRDESHLRKFMESIRYDGPLYVDTHNDSRSLSVNGQWFVTDLRKNFGITSRKTFNTRFPSQLPKKYWHHFIRGILDGDGCITFSRTVVINFTGTATLLNTLSEIFYDEVNIRLHGCSHNRKPPFQPTCRRNETIGQISYSGQNAKRILRWLYKGSAFTTRLDRKYLLFLND